MPAMTQLPNRRPAGALTRSDLMVVSPREAAARLGGYDTAVQVALEAGLSPTQLNVPAVDLGAYAGELGGDEVTFDLGGFAVVGRGRR